MSGPGETSVQLKKTLALGVRITKPNEFFKPFLNEYLRRIIVLSIQNSTVQLKFQNGVHFEFLLIFKQNGRKSVKTKNITENNIL